MEIAHIIFALASVCQLFRGGNSLRCRNCLDTSNPFHCADEIECFSGESCFVEETVSALQVVSYNLGCESTKICQSVARTAVSVFGRRHVGRSRDSRQVPVITTCVRCCDSDNCNNGNCTVTDECSSNPCSKGSTCQNTEKGYVCHCAPGYTGTQCQTDIDECSSGACQNGGTCNNLPGGFTCSCPIKYEGALCDQVKPGTLCLNCTGVDHPHNCSDLILCPVGQECYTDRKLGDNLSFNLGCRTHAFCNFYKFHAKQGRGSKRTHEFTTCSECCDRDVCNREICPPLPDHCASNPCSNGSTCQNTEKGYVCHCAPGYTGTQCQTDIDECASNPCANGGTCQDLPGKFRCFCPIKYEGTRCEKVKPGTVCLNCTAVDNPHTCSTIVLCPADNECYTDRVEGADVHYNLGCRSKAFCDFFKHRIQAGRSLGHHSFTTCSQCCDQDGCNKDVCQKAVDTCQSQPCQNGGTCTNDPSTPGGFTCTCASPYTGQVCSDTVDTCQSQPCQNGGTCTNDPSTPGGFTCTCASPYTGQVCSDTVDVCHSQPCQNGGTCTNDPSTPGGFTCTCASPYTGQVCSDRDVCGSQPMCLHGGNCTNDEQAADGFRCTCPPGQTGTLCQTALAGRALPLLTLTPSGKEVACQDRLSGRTCVQLKTKGVCSNSTVKHTCPLTCDLCYTDFCFGSPCKNNGSCTYRKDQSETSYHCACTPDYTGVNCTEFTDPCGKLQPCLQNGTCTNDPVSPVGYRCACPDFYTGTRCETVTDQCFSQPCQNNGTCVNDPKRREGFYCICDSAYNGTRCQNKKSPCARFPSNPCNNGGVCIDKGDNWECSCKDNYSGERCENNNCQFINMYSIGCGKKQDVVVLISGVVTMDPAQREIHDFLKHNLLGPRSNLHPDGTSMAVVQCSPSPRLLLDFSFHEHDVDRKIEEAFHGHVSSKSVDLSQALDFARKTLMAKGRPDALKVILVILDQVQDDVKSVTEAVERLKAECITLNVFAVRGERRHQSLSSTEVQLLVSVTSLYGKSREHLQTVESVHDLGGHHHHDYFHSDASCYH